MNSKLQALFVTNVCLILSSAFAERSWIRVLFKSVFFFQAALFSQLRKLGVQATVRIICNSL